MVNIPDFEIGDLVAYDYKSRRDDRYAFHDDFGIVIEIKKTVGSLPLYRIRWLKNRLSDLEPILFSPFQLRLIAKSTHKG